MHFLRIYSSAATDGASEMLLFSADGNEGFFRLSRDQNCLRCHLACLKKSTQDEVTEQQETEDKKNEEVNLANGGHLSRQHQHQMCSEALKTVQGVCIFCVQQIESYLFCEIKTMSREISNIWLQDVVCVPVPFTS